ncbi:hypothetical protein BOX15_Mlig011783g2 [Macrostomum lignano]|uniref:Hexosyltransferase n=1 Tax=Macrostomum lignano TaxID=282301 RepID=A0A267FYE3_9PLAT|nr:hypothetical protein BOX15_Mlig011783g2 [Macrostomum lignano]
MQKMQLKNRSLLSCIAFLAILGLCYPVFHFLLFDTNSRGATSVDELTAERQRRLHPSLRLESWGECFQAAPNLLVAVASSQADLAGRDQLRRLWRRKWRLQSGAAQLVFFVRYAASAPRDLVVEEFHRRQDLMLNAALEWQTDAAMLRWATAWYLERCPRTPYLLFVGDWPALNVRLVALHTAGGGVGAALAERHNVTAASVRRQGLARQKHPGTAGLLRRGNSTSSSNGTNFAEEPHSQPSSCLLLHRTMADALVRRVRGSETSWTELRNFLTPSQFDSWAAGASRLFCHSE